MDHWREVLPEDRFVEMDYEALVADSEPHGRRLVSACGLNRNEACLAPHLNGRVIRTASSGRRVNPSIGLPSNGGGDTNPSGQNQTNESARSNE